MAISSIARMWNMELNKMPAPCAECLLAKLSKIRPTDVNFVTAVINFGLFPT